MPKITKRTVDALEPRDREHVLWDDEITGFGVRVRPSGRKTYIVKYRDRGRAVKVTIGPHGEDLSGGRPGQGRRDRHRGQDRQGPVGGATCGTPRRRPSPNWAGAFSTNT